MDVIQMKGLSHKELEIIAKLEYEEKYFFTSTDIDKITKNVKQRYNIIQHLLQKKRIVKLNKATYYLIPIKAKSGVWSEDAFVIVDEMFNGKNYVIGGWAAAHYWHLTDQIPMQIDVYASTRQGKTVILNTRIIIHRTTQEKTERAVVKIIQNHPFRMQSKEETKTWLRSIQ